MPKAGEELSTFDRNRRIPEMLADPVDISPKPLRRTNTALQLQSRRAKQCLSFLSG
jgi:hypothetical protein